MKKVSEDQMIEDLGHSAGKVEFTEFQRWGQHRRGALGRPIGSLMIVFEELAQAFHAILKFNGAPTTHHRIPAPSSLK